MRQDLHHSDDNHAAHDAASSSYLDALVANALHAHRSGQFKEAAPLYREALAINPIHATALHYFGLLQHERCGYEAAAYR